MSLEKVAKRVPKSLRDYAVDTCFRGLRFKKSVLTYLSPIISKSKDEHPNYWKSEFDVAKHN